MQNKKTAEVLGLLASAPSGPLMHVPENNVPLKSKIGHAISLESFFDPSKAGVEEAFYEALSTLAKRVFQKRHNTAPALFFRRWKRPACP